jgi:hypothetical protein
MSKYKIDPLGPVYDFNLKILSLFRKHEDYLLNRKLFHTWNSPFRNFGYIDL